VEAIMFAMTGAGGKLGRAICAALLRRTPASTVRLGTRAPQELARSRAPGAAIVHADFDNPASLVRLFEGCSVALIISGDAPNDPRIRQHAAAFAAAKTAGVDRIVYTSFANAVSESRFLVAPSHVESEQMLHALGPDFTILRNNLYAENIMIEAARATGELVQPGSAGRAAYITYADVASATAWAMLGKGHENRTYNLTGPEALNHFEIADRLGAAWQRPVRARDVTPGEYADGLVRRGLPAFIIELLVSLHAAIAAGEYAEVSPDAATLAGAPIVSASAFLASA
jgi:NAD(P)H dehydrogenase (quinone)